MATPAETSQTPGKFAAGKKRRTASLKLACDACRASKVAVSQRDSSALPAFGTDTNKISRNQCDASRPKCKRCFRRGIECVFAVERTHAARNAALNHENRLLKTEIKGLKAQVSKLQSTASAEPAASSRDLALRYQREAGVDEELLQELEESYLVSGLFTAPLSRPYLGLNFELWSRCATIYPPLVPFKQPQAVADALLGPKSRVLDFRAM